MVQHSPKILASEEEAAICATDSDSEHGGNEPDKAYIHRSIYRQALFLPPSPSMHFF